jgi:hypothetical protein
VLRCSGPPTRTPQWLNQGCITALQAPQRPSEARAFRLEAQDRKFEKLPGTPGKLDAAADNEVHGYSGEHFALERSKSSAEERPKRAIGGSFEGTKKEEKQNFRVRFLHTTSRNHLIIFIYLSHPSWVRPKSGRFCSCYLAFVVTSPLLLAGHISDFVVFSYPQRRVRLRQVKAPD